MKQSDDPSAIQIASRPAANRVVTNIQAASQNTGVSFSYLMAQAGKESSFRSEAGSHVSSAAGLFQFTKNTWLHLIKTHGAQHGLGDLAEQIQRSARGDYVVGDAKLRQQILDLRRDPQISAMMAGEYAKDNKAWLEKTLGRPVDSTDLYMAHFLGPGGAAKVLKAKAQDPAQPAATLLPQAAHKNPSVFYDSDHTPRSVAAVYERIHHAIDRPMKQFARMEAAATKVAAAQKGEHHGHSKVAAGEQPWPFETGQWPPAYVPAAQSAADTPVSPPASPPETQVAYTDVSQSADQISAPMPPAPGGPGHDRSTTPLGKLLKGLFG